MRLHPHALRVLSASVVLAAVLLTGCGGGGDIPASPSDPSTPNTPVEPAQPSKPSDGASEPASSDTSSVATPEQPEQTMESSGTIRKPVHPLQN